MNMTEHEKLKKKYEFLLSQLEITDVDLWENDALLRAKPMYFQFSNEPSTVDEAVELAMEAADWQKKNA